MDNVKKTKKNIGDKTNPIPLSKKLGERTLLLKHLPAIPDADFSRYAKADKRPSPYVLNLLTARGLNLDELKIALFLFDSYLLKKNFALEHVVSLTEESYKDDNIGTNFSCYFGSPKNAQKFKMPFPSLIAMLKKANVILESNQNILINLRKLHDLGIITLTEIKNSNSCEADEHSNVKCVHFSLNNGVTTANINLKWDKPTKDDAPKDQSNQKKNSKSKAMQSGLI